MGKCLFNTTFHSSVVRARDLWIGALFAFSYFGHNAYTLNRFTVNLNNGNRKMRWVGMNALRHERTMTLRHIQPIANRPRAPNSERRTWMEMRRHTLTATSYIAESHNHNRVSCLLVEYMMTLNVIEKWFGSVLGWGVCVLYMSNRIRLALRVKCTNILRIQKFEIP